MLSAGIMPWNSKEHHRKFIETVGDYQTPNIPSPQTAKLRFWGEWEPDSYVKRLSGSCPKYLHTPFLKRPLPKVPKRQPINCHTIPGCGVKKCTNTDPFVFGNSFYYSCCQQITPKGNQSSMCFLDSGSIILFGSRIKGQFALDTVFVVGDKRKYTPSNILTNLKGFVPAVYPNIMQMTGNQQLVCYKGATPSNPVNGMYSFVPCRISNGSNSGFDRPVLSVSDFQSCNLGHILSAGNQNQGKKITTINIQEAQQIWSCISNAIQSQNYVKGFNFKY